VQNLAMLDKLLFGKDTIGNQLQALIQTLKASADEIPQEVRDLKITEKVKRRELKRRSLKREKIDKKKEKFEKKRRKHEAKLAKLGVIQEKTQLNTKPISVSDEVSSTLSSSSVVPGSPYVTISAPGEHKRKEDSMTLTSEADIRSLCIIGEGEFGQVLLVEVQGLKQPCVFKKMLRTADKYVVKSCRHEFKTQRKLFNSPKCYCRIPRPLYILDLFDENYRGVYGFCMEFCLGGSVASFSKSWCDDGICRRSLAGSSDDCESDSSVYVSTSTTTSSCDTCSSSSLAKPFNSLQLNPVKVCALCVAMIECLDEVFTAKPKLVHRDIKPDNFLVRVDPKSLECVVILGDLGFVQIQDSISSSHTSKAFVSSKGSVARKPMEDNGDLCGTFVYNSYESLKEGHQTQLSDAYSLGMSILALFTCLPPFIGHPTLRGVVSSLQLIEKLLFLLEHDMIPKLSNSPLFESLLSIDGGKYKPVHTCLNLVYTGLTAKSLDDRMSVHNACKKVQSIKGFLPKLGEGWICPRIEDIITCQRHKYGGDIGSVLASEMCVPSVSKWDSQV
ncbi:hypothetical protein ADUPG1_014217, partial [Aduncisulcus paluster]